MKITDKKGLIGILTTFFLLLIPAAAQIYHQDEYSWLKEMDRTSIEPHIHPPLYFLLGRVWGLLVGFSHERWVPAFFAIANVILVYFIVNMLTKRRELGLLGAGLFAFSAYSVLAGTQIDIDGALLPFFVLLMYLAYLHILQKDKHWFWVLGLAVVGGLLTKLSFVIGMGALVADWCILMIVEKNMPVRGFAHRYWKWFMVGIGTLVLAYFSLVYFLPGILSYAEGFKVLDFGHRAYFDLGFKILKSLVLLGPILFLGGLAVLWQPKAGYCYRFFWLYLIFCTLFYAVIFDFTTLTIERYFMFMIAPFAILAVEPISELFNVIKSYKQQWHLAAISGVTIAFLGYIISLPRHILPLDPKIAYAQHVLSGHWNFLIPISGGSGPIGFYVSALFIAVAWAIALVALVATRSKRVLVSAGGAILFLCVGAFTGIIVLEEFLFGGIYGSPNRVAWETLNYVNANPVIHQQQVITYYDIANYDLRQSGKYFSRFYTTATRDYVPKVTTFRGYYMIVDFPYISTEDRYWKLITRCPIEKQFQDKLIYSYVFDCTKLK